MAVTERVRMEVSPRTNDDGSTTYTLQRVITTYDGRGYRGMRVENVAEMTESEAWDAFASMAQMMRPEGV